VKEVLKREYAQGIDVIYEVMTAVAYWASEAPCQPDTACYALHSCGSCQASALHNSFCALGARGHWQL
jgi:hypothetical protein